MFPLYSETFIAEQIRAYTRYRPVLICRELVREVDDELDVVTIGKDWRALKRIGFSAFGMSNVFDNRAALNKVQLLHAHFAQDAMFALPLAHKLHVPLLVTCHGSDVLVSDRYHVSSRRLSSIRYVMSRRTLFKDTTLFFAVSDFLRAAMIELGFPAEKVVRHYVGVDTGRFVPGKGLNQIEGGEKFILSIARHTDVKGLDLLLKAFAKVLSKHPDLRLVQIGGGELTTDLKNLASLLEIDKSVSFLGPKPSDEVFPYIQSCAALVLSSRRSATGAEEAFGIVLNEASSCGIPCIGTRVGGIPEAIIDGETGFIVAPEDVDDLSEKISVIISNPDVAHTMGRRGREMVCASFDIRAQTQKLEGIYEQIT